MSDGDAIYLSDYVDQALAKAVYDKLEDGTFGGRILLYKGVVAFGPTLREREDELRSTLEDWILIGLKLGHTLPVGAGDWFRKTQSLDTWPGTIAGGI
jgi:hypothetical protein